MIYCFDIDGVICKTDGNNYKHSKPNHKVIRLINKLYNEGNTIKIFTARHMTKYEGNISKVKKYGYQKTKKWDLEPERMPLRRLPWQNRPTTRDGSILVDPLIFPLTKV